MYTSDISKLLKCYIVILKDMHQIKLDIAEIGKELLMYLMVQKFLTNL